MECRGPKIERCLYVLSKICGDQVHFIANLTKKEYLDPHVGPRTNNHLEGWHNRLKLLSGKSHPNLWESINLMKKKGWTAWATNLETNRQIYQWNQVTWFIIE